MSPSASSQVLGGLVEISTATSDGSMFAPFTLLLLLLTENQRLTIVLWIGSIFVQVCYLSGEQKKIVGGKVISRPAENRVFKFAGSQQWVDESPSSVSKKQTQLFLPEGFAL